MPYTMKKTSQCPAGKSWGVLNKNTGKVVPGGCHATKGDAQKHLAALNSNVPDAQSKSMDPPDGMLQEGWRL